MKFYEACAGIGGIALGFRQAGFQIAGLCERDGWCQSKLRQIFPESEIDNDVYQLTGQSIRQRFGAIDVFAAGFPCQPYSQSGKKLGADDERDLWPEILRLVTEVKPRWFVGENSFGFELRGWATCQTDLARAGYEAIAVDLTAAAFGLPTLERHLWILAAPYGGGLERDFAAKASWVSRMSLQLSGINQGIAKRRSVPESRFCSVGERLSRRSYKNPLRAIGNSVPPPMARFIAEAILQAERNLLEIPHDETHR